MTEPEEIPEPWTLFTDGSSCIDGFGAGLILTNPEGVEFTYAMRFRFEATNNEAEYEALIAGLRIAEQMGVKNLQANVDSRLVANQVNGSYVAKESGMVQYLEKNDYPWGEYIWVKFYKRTVNVAADHKAFHLDKKKQNPDYYPTYNLYGFPLAFKIWILESYPNSRKWWSKKDNVLPRALAWSNVTKFGKNDYNGLLGQDSNPNLELYATPVEQQTEWFKASIEYINGLVDLDMNVSEDDIGGDVSNNYFDLNDNDVSGNGNNDVLLLEGGDGFVDSVGGDKNHESDVLDELRALRKEVALLKVDDTRIAKLERILNDNFIPCNDRSKGLSCSANDHMSSCFSPEMPNDEVAVACTAIHNADNDVNERIGVSSNYLVLQSNTSCLEMHNAEVLAAGMGIDKADENIYKPNANDNDVKQGISVSCNAHMSTCSGPDMHLAEVAVAGMEIDKGDRHIDIPTASDNDVNLAKSVSVNDPMPISVSPDLLNSEVAICSMGFQNEVAPNAVYEGNVVSAKEVELPVKTYHHGRLGYMIYVDANIIYTPALANLHVSNLKPIGTSNGILCFSFGNNMMVCIANPLIGKKVRVFIPTSEPDGSKILLGFGVRPDNLDPTILKFSFPSSGEGNWYVLVFTLSALRRCMDWRSYVLCGFGQGFADVLMFAFYADVTVVFGFVVFLVYEELEYRMLVPNDINYSNLVRYVKKKFKLADGNQICLSYNIGSNNINIIDGDDVCYFVNEVSGQEVKKVYIKLGEPTIQVTKSSYTKPVDIDQNVPVFQNPYFIHQWKEKNPLMFVPFPPHAPTLVSKSKHRVKFTKHYTFDDKEALIYEIAIKCLSEGYQCKVLKSSAERNLSSKLLSKLIVPKVRDVKRVYTPKDIAYDVNLEWNVYISYKKAWTGKQLALASTQGCPIESFAQLPFYYYNIKRENEGTVTDIDADDEGRFKMCFIGFGVVIKSFLCYMRPLIIIDAAHLKGTYLGTNLVAVGMDGNNQIIPIATSVSQGETDESWTWFLRKLKECIGEVPNLTIISDRHYAITLACNTIFPNSFHGYCCRHLMMNCGMQSGKYKELYWRTCKAYTVQDFEKLMTDIHAVRPDAHQKLVEAGVEKWSRAKCPTNRYNYITSNSVESINALTKTVRKILITSLMDWFRPLLQDWYYECRQKYEDTPNDELTPWASAKIKYRYLKSSNWSVRGILKNNMYQVWDNQGIYTVYLNKGEHVSTWEILNEIQQVLPPDMGKKQSGRPKNRDRIRSQGEVPILNKCGWCGVKGHNRTSCSLPLPKIQNMVTKKQKSTQQAESSQGNNYRSETHHDGNHNVYEQYQMYEPQHDTNSTEYTH
ncbi:transposase, MuDR, MULE transposase domain protein [Tanacetum coccineum]